MSLTLPDYINLGWIWTKTFLPEVKRWRSKINGSGIRVFYGFDQIPGPSDKAGGGIIKIQDLEKVYPNCRQGANVLYLVSSALPYHAVRMARLARRSGSAVVLNQNGVAYPGWFGRGWKEHNRPMGRLLKLADHVFYQSRFCRLCADAFLDRPGCSAEVLYNPVDTNVFTPPAVRQPPGDSPRLLIAGSHQSRYRPRVALEVMRDIVSEYPGALLTVAGHLCWEKDRRLARKQLIEDIEDMGLAEHVEIRGPYSQKEAVGMFGEAHLLLHTKYNDPCPRLVIEAMACGLPVVYSATGGVPELVGTTAGVGVPGRLDWRRDHPPDPRRMSAAVKSVLSDWHTFSQAARRRALVKFDVRPWIGRHQVIFNRLLAAKNG